MTPTYPRIIPDRDRINDWYLDEDVIITLHNWHTFTIKKGFKFDSHSVPVVMRLFFPRYVDTCHDEVNDIYAALVHDALVACEHWLPYSRAFMDYEYLRFMHMPEYRMSAFRSYIMPLAVKSYSFIRYTLRGDFRGDVPNDMKITVCIDIDVVK